MHRLQVRFALLLAFFLAARAHASDPKRVVVVGGGYGGIEVASELARDQLIDVTLVDKNPFHTLVTRLHERAANGTSVTVPLAQIAHDKGFRFLHAEVTGLDPRRKKVIRSGGEPLPYDVVVIAMGGETAWPRVPGLRKHALGLRSNEEAAEIARTISERLARAAREKNALRRKALARVVIAGGGPSGVELAAEIAESLPLLAKRVGLARGEASVVLVQRGSEILESLDSTHLAERAYAEKQLAGLGVEILKNTALETVDNESVTLSHSAGSKRTMLASTVIWTGGVAAPESLKTWGFPVGAQGRIVVRDTLEVAGMKDVFSIGDAAAVSDPSSGKVLPMTAQFAREQGMHAAVNIRLTLKGERLRAYQPLSLGALTSLGRGTAVGRVLGIPVSGLLARGLKKLVELKHEGGLGMNGLGLGPLVLRRR